MKKFTFGIARKFNEIINGICYKINSERIEPASAEIKKTQCKFCGFFNIEDLFMKMRQIYLTNHVPFVQQI